MLPSIMRSASPIAILNDPSTIDHGERDIRIDDYVNDKIQTLSDLNSMDSLLKTVELQRAQLDSQLRDAQVRLEQNQQVTEDRAGKVSRRSKLFTDQQASIDKKLAIVTASDAPDEAVKKFASPIEKLRKLELANSYVEMLQEVDSLTASARSCLPRDPQGALIPYTRLRQLSTSLRTLQASADEAAVHMVTYVKKRSDRLWDEMKRIMTDEFELLLLQAGWPKAAEEPNHEWISCFNKLLDLQSPEFDVTHPVILLPFLSITKAFKQQFRFHFMEDRPTNSKQHPEQAFQWLITLFETWEAYLFDVIGPILAAHFKEMPFTRNSLFVNPLSAFIAAILPLVRDKLNQLISTLTTDPQLLSHLMMELMKFDDTLRTQFHYDGGSQNREWEGLTGEILSVIFDHWLQVEKDFAFSRYHDIVNDRANGSIDCDSSGPGRTKYTFGSVKVTDLLATVTMLYKDIRGFTYRLRYLIDVQLAILDQYHNRLKDSLNAYQAMTSTVGRTLHGASREEQAKLEGVGGLESLCKVFGSAELVISVLDDWGSELVFLQLWTDLQRRARTADADDTLAGSLSYTDVKSSISAAVGSDEDGGLFDETISAFQALRSHAERLMLEALISALPGSLRPYIQKPQWLTVDSDTDEAPSPFVLHVTAELDQPLQTLQENMAFLHKSVSSSVFRKIWRQTMDVMQDLLWNEILLNERFTTLGAAQLLRDVTATLAIVDRFVPNGSSSALGMIKLQEGVTLLNLPTKPDEGLSVRDAYNRFFTDNATAKQAIDELGFAALTYGEARQVLQRRVEASS